MGGILNSLRQNAETSDEDIKKGRAYHAVHTLLVNLATANLEHTISHYLYRRVLSLRSLLYRLLFIFIASIIVVALGVTTSSIPVTDSINAPLIATFVLWIIYVLLNMGLEIRKVSLLEDEFRRQETEISDFPQQNRQDS